MSLPVRSDDIRLPEPTAGGYLIPPGEAPGARSWLLTADPTTIASAVRDAATRAGLRRLQFQSGTSAGSYTGSRPSPPLAYVRAPRADVMVLARWLEQRQAGGTYLEWTAFIQHGRGLPTYDATAAALFEHWLRHDLATLLWRPTPPPPVDNPIVWPGGEVPERYSGQLYDYSRFAPWSTLGAFRRGVLPLGREALGWGHEAAHGQPLFLPRLQGWPSEQLGVLVCARQGSGKTELLVRWAVAAAAAGQTVFMIDVKGNLRGKVEAAVAKAGIRTRLLNLSTDPYAPSDRLNLLAGLRADQIDAEEQLMAFAEALLPEKALRSRDSGAWHRYAVGLARGALQILKLMEFWDLIEPGTRRCATLTDLHRLVAAEHRLLYAIALLRQRESTLPHDALRPRYSVEDCIILLAIALAKGASTVTLPGAAQPAVFDDGDRSPENAYMDFAAPVAAALDPFRPSGFMAQRTSTSGAGPEIRLDHVAAGMGPAIVTIACREGDSGLSTGILGLVMGRMMQFVGRRQTMPADQRGDLLLLLDETAHIRGFDPPSYVRFGRENRAAYVFVYQRLAMIGDEDARRTVLGNIGTTIYLGGLQSDDLDLFNAQHPVASVIRSLAGEQSAPGEPRSRSSTQQARDAPLLSALSGQRFPGGVYPALVDVAGHAPFFVDLDATSRS